jgi:hypothetical protein
MRLKVPHSLALCQANYRGLPQLIFLVSEPGSPFGGLLASNCTGGGQFLKNVNCMCASPVDQGVRFGSWRAVTVPET